MTLIRLVLACAGLWLAGYGISLLLHQNPVDLRSTVFWFAGGILLHDAVFAPLCAAIGLAGRRVLPRNWWAPAACGAVATVTLVLLAVPVVGRSLPNNPTILDRPYGIGLALALVTIWALVALYTAESHRRTRSASKGEEP
ncbi:hypothetical protein [Nocardia jejuensis]|uniref:hypothetical protein n=1 Tax=Nocardia jejuensis TaxID=328049 RepID=UPI000A68A73F|nr:hypothetical protein [Nocardia jejuensis]